MLKRLKKVVFAFGFLYTLNIVLQPLNISIPINLYSLSLFYFLGIPSVFYFILIKFF